MSETAVSQNSRDRYKQASPWPLVIALGFTLSEVGIILGFRAVAVVGLLLFTTSTTGILHETEYATNPERTLSAVGGLITLSGLWLQFSSQSGATVRGQSLLIAGIVTISTAALWQTRHVLIRKSDRISAMLADEFGLEWREK